MICCRSAGFEILIYIKGVMWKSLWKHFSAYCNLDQTLIVTIATRTRRQKLPQQLRAHSQTNTHTPPPHTSALYEMVSDHGQHRTHPQFELQLILHFLSRKTIAVISQGCWNKLSLFAFSFPEGLDLNYLLTSQVIILVLLLQPHIAQWTWQNHKGFSSFLTLHCVRFDRCFLQPINGLPFQHSNK